MRWKQISEARLNEARLYTGTMIVGTFKDEKSLRFYKNPRLSEVQALTQKMDLRGVSDGKNLFVFDAMKETHWASCDYIAAAGQWEGPHEEDKSEDCKRRYFERNGFYEPYYERSLSSYFHSTAIRNQGQYRNEWVDSGRKSFEIAPNTVVTVINANVLSRVPAFARLLRNIPS